MHLLLVDSPIGSGYSVVKNGRLIPSNIEEISQDLITMLKTFMQEHQYYKVKIVLPVHHFLLTSVLLLKVYQKFNLNMLKFVKFQRM